MKAKGIVTAVLLVFVGVSVAYLAVTESASQPAADTAPEPADVAAPSPAPAVADATPGRADVPTPSPAPVVADAAPEQADVAAPTPKPVVADAQPPAEAEKPPVHKLIACYFHRTQRCRKCLTIEAYSEEALKDAFPEALARGELEWQAVNVEEPANEHFVEDYQLTFGALVLVDTLDGEQKEWRNLERVWELVGDELKFKAYVEAQALTFLENDS